MERPRVLLVLALAGAVLLAESCMKQPPPTPAPRTVNSKDELVLYLDTLEHRYEAACTAMGVANWNSYSKEAPDDLGGAKAGFAKIFLDTTARNIITDWRRRSNSLADKPLSRRLELWYRCFLGGAVYADPAIAEVENRLQKRITDFRFQYAGAPITRAEASTKIRAEKKQPVRKALWQVTGQLSAAAAADLADRDGWSQLTLSKVADAVDLDQGVRENRDGRLSVDGLACGLQGPGQLGRFHHQRFGHRKR